MGETAPIWREIEPHLSCVLPLAWEYRHLGVPLEDLEAEGTLGLLEAAARFDPTRGVRFFSYAAWWIRKCIVEAISRQSMLVRLPRGPVRRLRLVREAERDLMARLGRAPTSEEIARAAGLREREVERTLLCARRVVSLDDPVGREGTRTLEDVLADPREERLDDAMARSAGTVRLLALLDHLPARQRTVLVLRFGLEGDPEQTLSAIGDRLGVTRERVRQLEKKALELLRRSIDAPDPVSSGKADSSASRSRSSRTTTAGCRAVLQPATAWTSSRRRSSSGSATNAAAAASATASTPTPPASEAATTARAATQSGSRVAPATRRMVATWSASPVSRSATHPHAR